MVQTDLFCEGTFMWAVQQMKEGKKVRRKGYEDWIIYLEESTLLNHEFEFVFPYGITHFSLKSIEATDWEIYEEPSKASEGNAPQKTLWEKRFSEHCLESDYDLKSTDVKETLKEVVDWIDKTTVLNNNQTVIIVKILEEKFGEQFFKEEE